MKVRKGFVSNSSTSSFCVYGWEKGFLIENNLLEKIKELSSEFGLEWIYGDCEKYIGYGNCEHDLHPEDTEDDDILVECPTKEEIKKLDEIVEKYNLPKPQMYSATWYNG